MKFSRAIISHLLIAMVILFFSIAQLSSVQNNFDDKIENQVKAAHGVVEGYPHWRIYQSRVLGPYMVYGVQKITDWSFHKSYLLSMLIWFALMFSVLFFVANSIWQSKLIALGTTGTAAFLNTTVMQGLWLYPWDYIDFTIFSLIIWSILKGRPIQVLAGIIVVEIFNREAALIMAAWLAGDSLLTLYLNKKTLSKTLVSRLKRQLLISTGLLITGILIIESLRNALLIEEVGPLIFQDVTVVGSIFEIQLLVNLGMFLASVNSLDGYITPIYLYNFLMLSILAICFLGIRSDQYGLVKISFLFLILWLFTLFFGLIYETRIWVGFIPFLVLAAPKILLAYSDKPADN